MTSTFQRLEPSFDPPRPAPVASPETVERLPALWPWLAAAVASVALAVPTVVSGALRQQPEPPPAVKAPLADPVTTGSILSPTRGMPMPDPVLRLFGVRLAGGESADLLWAHWGEVRERFPGVLDGLGITVRPATAGTADKPRFELIAGRYRNAAEAAALCGRLRAHEIVCAVRELEQVPSGPPS
ncbi:hypothetical protein [Alsobacter sp. R-9]